MNEFLEALGRLDAQLERAGVPAASARQTLIAYIAALQHRTDATWRTFYLSVHENLSDLAGRALPFAGATAAPLLALLDDDLGERLVPAAERARIRSRLVEYDLREASLPS